MLINIVGCDGCGKSTQIDLLIPWMKAAFGRPVRLVRKRDFFELPEAAALFGCSYERLMYDILPVMKDESRALFLFYMFASILNAHPPRQDELVVLDGGWQKHIATEAAMGLDWTWLLNVTSRFPVPDKVVLLDIDPTMVVERRARGGYGPHAPYECGCTGWRSDEHFIRQMNNTRRHLQRLAAMKKWSVVDGGRSRAEVFDQLRAVLAPAIAASVQVANVNVE